jgi:hypothetical protein
MKKMMLGRSLFAKIARGKNNASNKILYKMVSWFN